MTPLALRSLLILVACAAAAHAADEYPTSRAACEAAGIQDPGARSDEPTLTLAPPVGSVSSGARVVVGVYVRNGGAAPVEFLAPAQIDAELVTARARYAVALVRVEAALETRLLAPGVTDLVEYALVLPGEVAGRVVLQITRRAVAPVVLDVAMPEQPELTGERAPEAGAPLDPGSAPPAPAAFQYAEATLQRFRPYEPSYFLAGTDRPNARFQFSFQYRFFNPEGPWASEAQFLSGLFLGYTQSSLWDLEGTSKPFTDTNYRPELGWATDRVAGLELPGVAQTGLQFGYQHESNGRDGDESRSIHLLYAQPVLHFGAAQGFGAQVAPRLYLYLDDEDNPDIEEYRGYCDLRLSAGWSGGFQAAAIGRLGSGGEHGSIQIDLTYPLSALGDGNLDLLLQLQWFSGYGESLITYDRHTDALRFGVALVR